MVEPWPGLYTDRKLSISAALELRAARKLARSAPPPSGGVTAVSCCGANPGMVSWFVKQALLDIAAEIGAEGGRAQDPGRLGAADAARRRQGHPYRRTRHPARARTQAARRVRQYLVGRGICAEGLQPAELGWGTHEKKMPANARRHDFGCDAAIYLTQPGAGTRVRSWTPSAQAQHAFMITHNEAISIADYFTLRENGEVGLSADLPLRLSPVRRCGAVAARDGRRGLATAAGMEDPRRARNRRRHGRAWRAALRPRQKCLLVRLAALR